MIPIKCDKCGKIIPDSFSDRPTMGYLCGGVNEPNSCGAEYIKASEEDEKTERIKRVMERIKEGMSEEELLAEILEVFK